MLRTAGWLAAPGTALTAGFAGWIAPDSAALLLGGWDLTETGLPPASPSELLWTHLKRGTPPRCESRVEFANRIGDARAPRSGPGRQPRIDCPRSTAEESSGSAWNGNVPRAQKGA